MKVRWTRTAQGHLDAIYDHIARDSPHYAKRMVDRLTRRSRQISLFPRSGRLVPEHEDEWLREVIEGPFRMIYRIHQDRIDVLAVVHAARGIFSVDEEDD